MRSFELLSVVLLVCVQRVLGQTLVAGGYFTTAGGVSSTGVAQWNGTTWSALGGSNNGNISDVWALTVFNETLVAGGYSGIAASAVNVAKWDGKVWSALPGIEGRVRTFTVFKNELVAGGQFSCCGGYPDYGDRVWRDGQWSRLTGPGDRNGYYVVHALVVYNNELVGGLIMTSPPSGVYQYAGGAWLQLGSMRFVDVSSYSEVNALVVFNGKLVAGGQFTDVLDPAGAVKVSANNIAQWDGMVWSALGRGIGKVNALVVFNGLLVAGGLFTVTGDMEAANCVAQWNGETWSALGVGVDGYYYGVAALNIFSNKLVAGGLFGTAGGVPVNNIAQWDGSTWSAFGGGVDGVSPQVLAVASFFSSVGPPTPAPTTANPTFTPAPTAPNPPDLNCSLPSSSWRTHYLQDGYVVEEHLVFTDASTFVKNQTYHFDSNCRTSWLSWTGDYSHIVNNTSLRSTLELSFVRCTASDEDCLVCQDAYAERWSAVLLDACRVMFLRQRPISEGVRLRLYDRIF